MRTLLGYSTSKLICKTNPYLWFNSIYLLRVERGWLSGYIIVRHLPQCFCHVMNAVSFIYQLLSSPSLTYWRVSLRRRWVSVLKLRSQSLGCLTSVFSFPIVMLTELNCPIWALALQPEPDTQPWHESTFYFHWSSRVVSTPSMLALKIIREKNGRIPPGFSPHFKAIGREFRMDFFSISVEGLL